MNSRYHEALGMRVLRFNGMTSRELAIYLAGQEDGVRIKANIDQELVSNLEEQLEESRLETAKYLNLLHGN